MMKCALIEYNYYHDITLSTLVYILKKLNISVDIFTSNRNIIRDSLFDTDVRDVDIKCSDGILFKLNEFFHKYKDYDFIIVNSIEPKDNLRRVANFNIPTLAVLHNASLYASDRDYEKYLDRENTRILVLAQYITEYLSSRVQSYWITPVYFGSSNYWVESKNIFSVQGSIEYDRRNYLTLQDAVLQLIEKGINQFKIRIIGGMRSADGIKFKNEIEKKNIESFFQIAEGDISYKDYLHTIAESDFILPLIDNTLKVYQPYFLDKLTTSMPIAVGLNLIPIVHENLASKYEVSDASIVYQDNGLAAAMEKALTINQLEKDYLRVKMKNIKDKLIETSVANLQAAIADVIGGYS